MEFPYLLLVLLALPFAMAAVVVGVHSARRRRSVTAGGVAAEPNHRAQSDAADVQSAVVHPAPAPRKVQAARDRRADSARPTDG